MMKTRRKAQKTDALPRGAFQFYSRLDLRELTGIKAKNIRELYAYIQTVPDAVIYHHTHHFLQQHQFLNPEPPNDFAYWVRDILGLGPLGEKIASININEHQTIPEIRGAFEKVLREYLSKKPSARFAPPGEEFHFIKSVSFIFSTPYLAHDLKSFADGLKKITVDSIYFHMFEAKLRLKRGGNDFSYWLETSLLEKELGDMIARLDPYTHTMDQLRKTIIRLIQRRIKQKGKRSHAQ